MDSILSVNFFACIWLFYVIITAIYKSYCIYLWTHIFEQNGDILLLSINILFLLYHNSWNIIFLIGKCFMILHCWLKPTLWYALFRKITVRNTFLYVNGILILIGKVLKYEYYYMLDNEHAQYYGYLSQEQVKNKIPPSSRPLNFLFCLKFYICYSLQSHGL